MWLLKDTATEVRDQVPSLWSQDPFAPHKRHQPHLEQNGFNQLRHPHSPGSGATKRLGSCPQRTVRLMCLSTLQGSAGQARGGGVGGAGREEMTGSWNTGKQRGPCWFLGPRAQPQYSGSPLPGWRKVMEKRQGSKSQQQEKQQQLFPSPINILHYQARERGGKRDWGGEEGGEAATCVARIKAMKRWCQTPHHYPHPPFFLKL